MRRKALRQPIRYYVTFIVMLMGLLGLGFALATGEYYRHLITENQRTALARFGGREVADLLDSLSARSKELGLNLQRRSVFLRHYRQRDTSGLTATLASQYRQYFVTAGILKVERLQVFDLALKSVALADSANPPLLPQLICPGLMDLVRSREGPARLKPLGDLCLAEGRPIHAMVVPVGGLRIKGYVLVVTDPVHWLRRVENALNMPTRIRSPAGAVLYSSESWDSQAPQARLLATSVVNNRAGRPVLNLDLASDTEVMHRQLTEARFLIVTIAGLATIAVVLLALFLFQVTTVRPLRLMTERLHLLRQDRSRLGEEITLVANAEVAELAEGFNEMASDLNELHATLESLAYSDALTGLPNRVLFLDKLNHLIRLAQRGQQTFALFMIDLDKFKPINDTLGHHAGDLLLAELGARMKAVLRSSDTVAHTGHTLARLGGDEFAILLPSVSAPEDAAQVASKLLDVLDMPFEIEGHRVFIGMSIGAVLYPDHGADAETLCRNADSAMYAAKRSGSSFALFGQLRAWSEVAG